MQIAWVLNQEILNFITPAKYEVTVNDLNFPTLSLSILK